MKKSGGTDFPVYRKDVDEYALLYQDVDIEQELRNMKGWCMANPAQRKTARGVRAFINSLLCISNTSNQSINHPVLSAVGTVQADFIHNHGYPGNRDF